MSVDLGSTVAWFAVESFGWLADWIGVWEPSDAGEEDSTSPTKPAGESALELGGIAPDVCAGVG